MKNYSELFSHFRAFYFEIHIQFHVYVQNLRSDNVKEYMSEQFQSFMLQNGILHQTSYVDTPSQTHKSLFPIEPQVFGCTCFVWDVCPHVSKLDLKSLKCIFFGYSQVQKGYRCYCPSLPRYLVSTDVTYLENTFFSQDPIHTS